uniref:Type I restriction enzyme, S subunit n=1 Tax=Candidatus Kentrum sp. TUN TaxID=2126343 RepID=A0A450ZQN6_9GAMM|nr:MAG: type I restriction enzyme, S subunit [Candidatus Kentron sp. TUN]VFK59369.1 MAG: type I restriction enzyme, S subunit [Candidatus Kentron sp. TUN]VFK62332.1 MAG: type I restriction enzyme, S subunit [Candidatus Kentron sp. TUN]
MDNEQLVVPLSDLIEIKHGYPFSSRYFVDVPTEYILLTPGNFSKNQRLSFEQNITYYDGPIPDGFILQNGDLLIVMTDLTREMAILGNTIILQSDSPNKKILHNQRIGKVINKDHHADRAFLMYLLNSQVVRRKIKSTATGTTVRHTSPDNILRIKVWAPKISEQEKIVNILSQWDRAIFLMERLITEKRRRRKALTQRLLSGKQRFSRFIRSTATQEIHPSCPVDWDYPCIGEVARLITNKNKAGNRLPILSCTKYQGLVNSADYFSRQVVSKDLSAYKLVRRGTFVYATNHIEEGSIGYQDLYDEALISPMYTVFETCDRILNGFLYLILKTERYRHIFAINTNASVDRRGGLRWKEFAKIRVPVPSRAEQENITHVFTIIDREIDLLHQQLTALWQQKKGLMQKLLAGRSRIR